MSNFIQQLPDLTIQRALLSVSDKTGIVELATSLHKKNIELISTGGTAKILRDSGLPVTDVSEITGFPECLDGRVKTLHPMIHGALLARPSLAHHAEALDSLDIRPIQLLVVNLYPFEEAVADQPDDLAHAIENIDIGGPAMIRAAAKNFENVCVLTEPGQYTPFTEELAQSESGIKGATRAELALKAFQRTASYDSFISRHLSGTFIDTGYSHEKTAMPDLLSVQAPLYHTLRYGENPHQAAAAYGSPDQHIECFHGKELSYNNYLDIDAALQLGTDFSDSEDALCAIFKHNLPCGVALAETSAEAWEKAFATDTVSPFGGIILFNRSVDRQAAEAVDKIFSEIILAPDFDIDALEILTQKANRRLIRIKKWVDHTVPQIRTIPGGYLMQQQDTGFDSEQWKVVTRTRPDEHQHRDLDFAWKVVKHVKSNAIVYAKNRQTIGIGTGQPNRVDSSRFAVQKSEQFGHAISGSVIASDAFFPFADGVEEAAKAGAKAIIQPGGSVRDQEVIETADRYDMAMIMTGARHFRH